MSCHRSDADELRHVIRATRSYGSRARVSSPSAYRYRLDVDDADAVVDIRRSIGAWIGHVTQDGADGEREHVAYVRAEWNEDVRVVVFGALAACDGLRSDLDDVDDGLHGLDPAALLALLD